MDILHILHLLVAILASLGSLPIESFILNGADDCPVGPPCACKGGIISCENKGFDVIPQIFPLTSSTHDVLINLSNNNLTAVTSGSFANVSMSNQHFVHIDLSNNAISAVSETAFSGIENMTASLNLQMNQLTTIPTAVEKLENLKTLELAGNPLINLDVQTLVAVQRHLQTFTFSAGHMDSWPRGIQVLRNLNTLSVDDIHFSALPYDAFHGFESSLRTLRLKNTNLGQIPDICNLKHLQAFAFNDNVKFNENIPHQFRCYEPLRFLHELELEGDNITQFPAEVLTAFPYLLKLSLSDNKLRYIPSESVPDQNHITILDLSKNLLGNVPYAINNFQKLHALNMSANRIVAIEHDDFSGITHLSLLYLQSNPIQYVDSGAFTAQNMFMTYLNLANTHLDQVPVTLSTLQSLVEVDLHVAPEVECSCDKMADLRTWNVTDVVIHGNCEFSRETIKEFIVNSLPLCPS